MSSPPNKSQQVTVSPIDGSEYVRRDYANAAAINNTLSKAQSAQRDWRNLSIAVRSALIGNAVDRFVAMKTEIADEITRQIGRPIRYTPNEVNGFEARARHMISISEAALQRIEPASIAGFTRYIKREPVGVVFVVAPWNYPLLTAVNAIVPALVAGNTVILKHSAQTPLCAERIAQAFQSAGIPDGVFQYLHLTHDDTQRIIRAPEVNHVCFTGSVSGGTAVEQAAAGRFIDVGLELGGNDPAYVRNDADLTHAVETVVDGAFFNSGQSCCGIQRIYVHADIYERFVEQAAALTQTYKLGDPLHAETTLGPVVRVSAAQAIRAVCQQAIAQGARNLIDGKAFARDDGHSAYVAPHLFVNVDHSMTLMNDECFGPVAGIMKVRDDAEAIRLMNDSPYGLTAAVFTQDEQAAVAIGDQVETGTFFMNRCDYLDPALAWTGVKNTGRGATLSSIGYEHMTRPKSYHLKTQL